ncbi:hypothetical protein RF11_15907 [Thelohanellus kitauei]|uniref:Tc1-like transposase DDE domain-containing protein n=1 Tax=Thelohanellus kitauei TaxID=669202 RepID=A0A0C2MTS6_THEKT|nr:hypothetical protein RF11_15907 [Thelohanellus kitauei]
MYSGSYDSLVMNNLHFQKTEIVLNTITAFSNSPVSFPPYSPFLNPIENIFSKWKLVVSQMNSRNAEELFELICTTSFDRMAFYTKMGSYLPNYIPGNPLKIL